MALPGPLDVLLAINDNDADGRDISWLWDVDFEMLEEYHNRLSSLVCTGQRGEEMAIRLKYAGVPTDKITIARNIPEAVRYVLQGTGASAYFLTTYTSLWPLVNILKGYVKKGICCE